MYLNVAAWKYPNSPMMLSLKPVLINLAVDVYNISLLKW